MGSSSRRIVRKAEEVVITSPTTLEKNRMKVEVVRNKIQTAPKLKLYENNLYQKRKYSI